MNDGTVTVNEISVFEVKVDFGDFYQKTIAEKMSVYAEAIKNKLASVEFAVEQVYGDTLSDEEMIRLVIEIKQQNGMQLTLAEQALVNPVEE